MTKGEPVKYARTVDGVRLTTSVSVKDARKMLRWSKSEAILHIGADAPAVLDALASLLDDLDG